MSKAIEVILSLSASPFMAGLNKAQGKIDAFGKKIFTVGNLIQAAFAGYAVQRVLSFGKAAVDAAREQEIAEQTLAQTLLEKGALTKETLSGLVDYADTLQRTTTASDEQIVSTMAMIAQYGILGDDLKRATRIAVEWSARGKGMEQTGELLGKAFAGNTAGLSKYGIVLDENIPKSERFIAAMAGMEKMSRGVATALNQGSIAQLSQMGKAWGEMKEGMGGGIAQGLTSIVASMSGITGSMWDLKDATAAWMSQGLAGYIESLAAKFMLLGGAIQKAWNLNKMNPFIAPFLAGYRAITGSGGGAWAGLKGDFEGAFGKNDLIGKAMALDAKAETDWQTASQTVLLPKAQLQAIREANLARTKAIVDAEKAGTQHLKNQMGAAGR